MRKGEKVALISADTGINKMEFKLDKSELEAN